jgi:hypothetical protein
LVNTVLAWFVVSTIRAALSYRRAEEILARGIPRSGPAGR